MAKEVIDLSSKQNEQGGEGMKLSEKVLRDIEMVEGVRREAARREDPNRRPLAQHLASELFGYTYNRLHGKMRSGEIVSLVQQVKSRVPLVLSAGGLDDLHRNREYRDELAVRTIGEAWARFYDRVLLAGKWNPQQVEEGRAPASLKSYFFGMCLLHFPRVYVGWAAEQEDKFTARTRGMTSDELEVALGYRSEQTPELIAKVCEQVRIMINAANPRIRSVMTLAVEGYTQAEIAEELNMTVPMVEGILYRFRQSARSKVFQIWQREPHELLSFAQKPGVEA
ncbi:hypothetical protein ACFVFS_37785 [Kitasatospora sp. NPDC057692]|uniref:hypothetical protein n=1 Tax=Kitasatospora sp. NPDC057692 TaxID=3346215 RepID=UPI00369719EB